ncbi:hypothetical protein, partial [Mycobacterium tuberculosis]
ACIDVHNLEGMVVLPYLGLEVLTRARAALTSTEEPAKQQTTNTPALTT